MDNKKIKGLIVAPFTAFTSDGEVDLGKVSLQQKFYRDNGISGAFVCGTTGEGSSLTIEEKKSLFKEWGRCRYEDFALIAFLGGTSSKECAELAMFAESCGFDAVAVTAPYYQKAANVKDLSYFCAEIADAVPDMPFYYYHIPCLTHVIFAMYDFLQVMDGLLPNLAGIKYTFENLMDYQLCLNYKNRKYNIMWGRDEMLLPALSIGAEAFVGSTYGYNAPIYNEIIRCFEHGDIKQAADLQLVANKLIELLGKYGNGCGKAFMKASGLDLGPARKPLETLDEETYSRFESELASLQFDRWKCR